MGARRAHVDLGTEANVRRHAGFVEIENHSLTLAKHSEDRADERVARHVVVAEIGVTHDDAEPGNRVVRLHDSLHQPALATLPALMQLVHTFMRLDAPLTRARIR